MKKYQTNCFIRTSVLALLCLGFGGLALWQTAGSRVIFAQSREAQTAKRIMPAREAATLNSLSALLSSDGVSVQEMVSLPSRVADSHTVMVRLESTEQALAENDFLTGMPQDSSVSLLDLKAGKGALARQRSLELSPTQILVVAVNKNKQTLWWDLLPDPRLFNAETADDTGKLSGQMLYRTTAETLVAYPADEAITELRFYHPDWNGQTYQLQLLDNLALPSIK